MTKYKKFSKKVLTFVNVRVIDIGIIQLLTYLLTF